MTGLTPRSLYLIMHAAISWVALMFCMSISITAKVTHVASFNFSFHRRCLGAATAMAPGVLAFLLEVNHKKTSLNSNWTLRLPFFDISRRLFSYDTSCPCTWEPAAYGFESLGFILLHFFFLAYFHILKSKRRLMLPPCSLSLCIPVSVYFL